MNQRLPHHNKINITPDELHNAKKLISSDLATLIPSGMGNYYGKRQHAKRTPIPTMEGGVPMGLKRMCSPATRAPGSKPHTISRMSEVVATCTDEHYIEIIQLLTYGWMTATNDRGSNVAKR